MKLSKFSIHKLQKTFDVWQVDYEYSLPVTNYLVHGLEPGSFFTSVLANDFAGAMTYSHQLNTISGLKKLTLWLKDQAPPVAWGSYRKVSAWTMLPEDDRRLILENRGLILTAEQETWETLQD